MEHKTRVWWRKSSERASLLKALEEEAEKVQGLQSSLKTLNGKLSSVIAESTAKDALLEKQAKVAEEAVSGWNRAEMEVKTLKRELDEAVAQRISTEERARDLDIALKECTKLTEHLRQEKVQMINDSLAKASREKENLRLSEERLAELNKKFAKVAADNINLNKFLQTKERIIEDLIENRSQLEENISAIIARLDSSEKRNASLKHEVNNLQKELRVRNEERILNLKSIDAAHQQHLESLKKIMKLEAACQRLRAMVPNNPPGPASVARMKNDVEMLGKDTVEMRRRKQYFTMAEKRESEGAFDSCSRKESVSQRLHAINKENKMLKNLLAKKNNELHSSRLMSAHTTFKLSQVEKQVEELSEASGLGLAGNTPLAQEVNIASLSEGVNDDTFSCAESWASALMSELDHFTNGTPMTPSCRTERFSDVSLMDDFNEIEKLALACKDNDHEKSKIFGSGNKNHLAHSMSDLQADSLDVAGKKAVPIGNVSDSSDVNCRIQSSHASFENAPSWLKDIMIIILQKQQETQKHLDVILEEVRVAFSNANHSDSAMLPNGVQFCDDNSQESPDKSTIDVSLNQSAEQQFQIDKIKSLNKLIELVKGLSEKVTISCDAEIPSCDGGNQDSKRKWSLLAGHVVCLWKRSELEDILENLVKVCDNLLCGNISFGNFVEELASALNWILNNHFSLQDVSDMKYIVNSFSELHGSYLSSNEESKPLLKVEPNDENHRVIIDMVNIEAQKKHVKEGVQSTLTENECTLTQVLEPNHRISSLEGDLKNQKESQQFEGQIESHQFLNGNPSTQFSAAKHELTESNQRLSILEQALKDESNRCEELEEVCLELQLQLESFKTINNTFKPSLDDEQRQLGTNDLGIHAASEKLTECQETIPAQGKHHKTMASPGDAALSDEVLSPPLTSKINRPVALQDMLLAEAGYRLEETITSKTRDNVCDGSDKLVTEQTSNAEAAHHMVESNQAASSIQSPGKSFSLPESDKNVEADAVALDTVPRRQKSSFGLWKLFPRRKREEVKYSN